MVQVWMDGDVVVEILTGVGLVVHQEALIAEPEILDQNSVAWELLVAVVGEFDPPKPRVQPRVKPKRDPMSEPALLSFPHIAIVRGPDAKPSFGSYQRQSLRPLAARAQIEAGHAVADRQGERLIDDDPTVRFRVLDGEDRAGRQDADRKPGPIGDPQKVEIVSTRRRQNLNRRIQHSPSRCPRSFLHRLAGRVWKGASAHADCSRELDTNRPQSLCGDVPRRKSLVSSGQRARDG